MEKWFKTAIAVSIAIVILLSIIAFSLNGINIEVKYAPADNGGAGQSAIASTEAYSYAGDASTTASQVNQITEPVSESNETSATQPEAAQSQTLPSVSTSSEEKSLSSMSKADIVALYNRAVNKVKTEASELTRNYKHLSVPEDKLELPSAIQGIGKTAIGTFVKGSDTPESWTSKEDMQIVFPVGNTDYSSKLTEEMVESASCEDKGDSYIIKIKLYDDSMTSPEKGQGYAGVFNTITASTITSVSIPTVTFNNVEVKGTDGSVSCTIEKSNEQVTEITFSSTDNLDINVKVFFSELNAKLALVTEENYSIEY